MKHLNTLVAISLLLLLSGCGLFSSPSTPPEEVSTGEPSNRPVELSNVPTPPPAEAEEETPVPNNVQVYQDDNGMFALALPEGYSYEPTEQGMTFVSEDGGFAGEIVYQATETASSNLYPLEEQLKAIITAKFGNIDWEQNGQRQPDGSVRLAWETEDEQGQTIDALSFVETHGQTIFALMLYAVDKVYNDYSDDARIIVGTYVVRQGPAIAESSDAESSNAESKDGSETGVEADAESNTDAES